MKPAARPFVSSTATSAVPDSLAIQPDLCRDASPTPSIANRSDGRFYSRVFALVTIALLSWTLYKILLPFFGPLVWALFLAFLLHPVHVRLTGYMKNLAPLSAMVLTAATLLMLVGPFTVMSATFINQTGELVHWLQDTLAKQSSQQYQMLADMPVVGHLLGWLHDSFGVSAAQIQGWIGQGAEQVPHILADLSRKLFLGAFSTVFAFVVMLFMLFFFLRDGTSIVTILRDLVPMTPARRELLMDHIAAVTRAVVFGTGITALIQGTMVGIAFVITGLGAPLVFGVLAAILALLPFGGTAIVWLPATLILIGQEHWGMAIVMLAIGLLSSTVDNVVRPLLISGRGDVSTLTVFVGVLGGAIAFGPIGFFLGPVVLALIIALIRFALELRRA